MMMLVSSRVGQCHSQVAADNDLTLWSPMVCSSSNLKAFAAVGQMVATDINLLKGDAEGSGRVEA